MRFAHEVMIVSALRFLQRSCAKNSLTHLYCLGIYQSQHNRLQRLGRRRKENGTR